MGRRPLCGLGWAAVRGHLQRAANGRCVWVVQLHACERVYSCTPTHFHTEARAFQHTQFRAPTEHRMPTLTLTLHKRHEHNAHATRSSLSHSYIHNVHMRAW